MVAVRGCVSLAAFFVCPVSVPSVVQGWVLLTVVSWVYGSVGASAGYWCIEGGLMDGI